MDTHDSIIFFSNVTRNTERFVGKLGRSEPGAKIPLMPKKEGDLFAQSPYVLFVPTYGDGSVKRSVPPQVKRFLNIEQNRELIRGVVGGGNMNFGKKYCRAGEVVAYKCEVPLLAKFELMGTLGDVDRINGALDDFWAKDGSSLHV